MDVPFPVLMLKVSYFRNEFLKSSFLPKYEKKIVRISTLTTQGRLQSVSDKFVNIATKCLKRDTEVLLAIKLTLQI